MALPEPTPQPLPWKPTAHRILFGGRSYRATPDRPVVFGRDKTCDIRIPWHHERGMDRPRVSAIAGGIYAFDGYLVVRNYSAKRSFVFRTEFGDDLNVRVRGAVTSLPFDRFQLVFTGARDTELAPTIDVHVSGHPSAPPDPSPSAAVNGGITAHLHGLSAEERSIVQALCDDRLRGRGAHLAPLSARRIAGRVGRGKSSVNGVLDQLFARLTQLDYPGFDVTREERGVDRRARLERLADVAFDEGWLEPPGLDRVPTRGTGSAIAQSTTV